MLGGRSKSWKDKDEGRQIQGDCPLPSCLVAGVQVTAEVKATGVCAVQKILLSFILLRHILKLGFCL